MRHLRLLFIPLALALLATLGRTPEITEREIATNPADLACSAIGIAFPEITVSPEKLPVALADWGKRLNQYGDVVGTLVPFSRAPGSTSLGRPRVLLTAGRIFLDNSPRDPFPAKRDLTNRVFVGVTTSPDKSQTLEFISWNQTARRFDFGVIEHFETPSKRKLVYNDAKRAECLTCHRTAGPIFPVFPWTGFSVDPLFSIAMIEEAARRDPDHHGKVNRALQNWKEAAEGSVGRLRFAMTDPKNKNDPEAKLLNTATLYLNGQDTGVRFFERGESDRTAEFDGAVRDANRNLSLPNQIVNGLPAEHRPTAARLVVIRSLVNHYGEFPHEMLAGLADELKTRETAFAKALAGKVKGSEELASSRPSQVRDFDPVSGQPNHHPIATSDDHLSYVATIETYNTKREAGDLGVPDKFRPSGPPAFLTDNVPPAYTLPAAIAAGVPGEVRLFRKDLDPLLDLLESTAGKKGPGVLLAALDSAEMTEVLTHGVPNRETLLVALHEGVRTELKKRKLSARVPDLSKRVPPLGVCDGAGQAPKTATNVNSGEAACRRCHVGNDKVGRLRFDFDPEDRTAWQAALADAAKRERTRQLLAKVIRRLENDSMPPEESPERTLLEKKPQRASELRALLQYLKGL